mmetsp:Transcript_21104/g.37965  ORF Transcript_21104/g.37965 Transcript_21104/m.37965 type:complete len:398 (-) Transcript_21104:159-1352(-)
MAPKAMTSQQLLAELQQDNFFFDQLVDMIPTKLYVAGQSGDDYNPKYFKGQSKESKEARRAKIKQAKRAKLDPTLAETTTQVKQRLESNGTNNTAPKHPPLVPRAPGATSTANTAGKASSAAVAQDKQNNKSRIEALREKLHAKLAEKRAQRPSDPSTVSKRAARRAEKKKRQEEAAEASKRKKKATSNAEDKSNGSNKRFKFSSNGSAFDDPAADLAQVDFGRLAGLNPIGNNNYTATNKALKNLSKTKNLEKMLADAEAKKKRLEELKQGNEEEKQKAANMQWGDAIKEASGERVKDDPAKIKKALKRKAAKKQKSATAWKNRMEHTKQKMDERQKIRNHNLNKRKMGGSAGANLSKKRIATEGDAANTKDAKRRLSRPGFEGRKQEFLNKKKDQ